jgi:hypothetical protein
MELFYLDGLKIVSGNIADLLMGVGLAYWIGDPGWLAHSHQRVHEGRGGGVN